MDTRNSHVASGNYTPDVGGYRVFGSGTKLLRNYKYTSRVQEGLYWALTEGLCDGLEQRRKEEESFSLLSTGGQNN